MKPAICSINLVLPDPVGPFNINGTLFCQAASNTFISLDACKYFGSLDIKYFDLSIQNRNNTNDQVTIDAANAIKELGSAIEISPSIAKEAVIPPAVGSVKQII